MAGRNRRRQWNRCWPCEGGRGARQQVRRAAHPPAVARGRLPLAHRTRLADRGGRQMKGRRNSWSGMLQFFFFTLDLSFRSKQALVYGYLVPILFLVAFGSVFRSESPALL